MPSSKASIRTPAGQLPEHKTTIPVNNPGARENSSRNVPSLRCAEQITREGRSRSRISRASQRFETAVTVTPISPITRDTFLRVFGSRITARTVGEGLQGRNSVGPISLEAVVRLRVLPVWVCESWLGRVAWWVLLFEGLFISFAATVTRHLSRTRFFYSISSQSLRPKT